MWYLKFHKEPNPGVIFYTQSVPLDALNKVKQEHEALTKQLEIAMGALKCAKEFKTIYQYPEHEIRHALAIELPYGIDEALAEIEKLKEPKP